MGPPPMIAHTIDPSGRNRQLATPVAALFRPRPWRRRSCTHDHTPARRHHDVRHRRDRARRASRSRSRSPARSACGDRGGAGPTGAGPTGAGDAAAETDDGAVADPAADAAEIVASSATAMGEVTSVEFRLRRDGAPIFIDEFERIALDSLRGQFTVPTRAQAELSVTVNGNLATRLGAVAIDDEVWISNPVTGDFETLPAGYDIDPSRFFDPENGWRPLLANLQDVDARRHRRPWWRALPRERHRAGSPGERHHRRARARPGRRRSTSGSTRRRSSSPPPSSRPRSTASRRSGRSNWAATATRS